MKSGESRPSRDRAGGRDEAQVQLEGILPPEREKSRDEHGEEEEPVEPTRRPKASKSRSSPTRANADRTAANPLLASLDTLEENITLLLARHEQLAAAHVASEERRRSRQALDPIELQDRVQKLEEQRQRLERHAAYLEDRIRGLLSRVRYVIES